MATLNEIIYIMKNEINDYSNDYKVSNRQFEFMINYLRSTLIRQSINKGRGISSNIIQNLGPVPVHRENITGDPSISMAGDIITTVDKIPHPLEANDKDLFTYVGGLDRRTPFDYSNRSYASHWAPYNKYTGGLKKSFFRDSKMYVTGCKSLPIQAIWIDGVFEDPREVYNFQNSHAGNTCAPTFSEQPYPLSEYMITTIANMIKKGELDMKFYLNRDTKNDGAANEQPQRMGNYGYGGQGYGGQGNQQY